MKTKIAVLALALMTIGVFACAKERIVDNIDLPFVNDPAVIGDWTSVDFVSEPAQFTPGKRDFRGDLYMKGFTFLAGGKTPQAWWTWTKGVVMHSGDKTASAYTITGMNGRKYLFLEWKSGDYTIRHRRPQYYVLEKK